MANEATGKKVKMLKAVVTEPITVGRKFYQVGETVEVAEEQAIRIDAFETDIDLGKKKAEKWLESYVEIFKKAPAGFTLDKGPHGVKIVAITKK
jgi:hypothetical protein